MWNFELEKETGQKMSGKIVVIVYPSSRRFVDLEFVDRSKNDDG